MSKTQGWLTGVALAGLIGAGSVAAMIFWLLVTSPDQMSAAAGGGHLALGRWIILAVQRLLAWL